MHSLTPVQASGFTELQERMDAQQRQADKHKSTLEAIRKQVNFVCFSVVYIMFHVTNLSR